MGIESTLVFTFVCLSSAFARITEIALPPEVHKCFEQQLAINNVSTTIGERIFSRCVHKVLWSQQVPQMTSQPLGADAVNWISGLVEMNNFMDLPNVKAGASRHRPRRQASRHTMGGRQSGQSQAIRQILDGGQSGQSQAIWQTLGGGQSGQSQTRRRQPRVRKEYRMLSDRERFLFHRAINMMKADTSIAPNKYDALGRLHFMSVNRAHYGPNFLPWHRLFLVVMENALREKIPSVTIPYWDSTLDDALADPRSSVLWTPQFFGQAKGYVEDGPFANWDTPAGRLIRYFGSGGAMMNWTHIYNAFRQNHLQDISDPYANLDNSLEDHHDQVHTWVGGHMAPPALAAFDPVFYLLHAHIDLLWEIFRGLQKRRGIDPTTDYPQNITLIPDGHRYNDPSGFGSLLNRHGLSNVFTDNIYKYDRPPSCTVEAPYCGSQYLRCDTSGQRPKCISTSIFDIGTLLLPSGLPMAGGSGIREFRSTRNKELRKQAKIFEMIEQISNVQCQTNNVNENYMNNFNIDGVMDKENWAYIPVQVIYKQHNSTKTPLDAVYDICKRGPDSKSLSRIFVETNGINYNGLFKGISHFKNNLMTSSATVYIGVRKPTQLFTEALVSAYDECGRICQPYCLDRNGTRYSKCHGAIRVMENAPFMYGNDVRSAVNMIWKDDKNGLPYIAEKEIFMTMLCDTTKTFWPW